MITAENAHFRRRPQPMRTGGDASRRAILSPPTAALSRRPAVSPLPGVGPRLGDRHARPLPPPRPLRLCGADRRALSRDRRHERGAGGAVRRPGYPYDGLFLSELAATGRERIGVRCKSCPRVGSYRLATLIATHGDIVLPHALSLISADCPRRASVMTSPGCQAVFSDPVTVAEEAAIKAARMG